MLKRCCLINRATPGLSFVPAFSFLPSFCGAGPCFLHRETLALGSCHRLACLQQRAEPGFLAPSGSQLSGSRGVIRGKKHWISCHVKLIHGTSPTSRQRISLLYQPATSITIAKNQDHVLSLASSLISQICAAVRSAPDRSPSKIDGRPGERPCSLEPIYLIIIISLRAPSLHNLLHVALCGCLKLGGVGVGRL